MRARHEDLFVVTGDAPKEFDSFKSVCEVNSIEFCRIIKSLNQGKALVRGENVDLNGLPHFNVGGALIPPRANEQNTLCKKVDAGFDYFFTQMVFDPYTILDFYAEAEESGNPVNRHVQVGLSPASTPRRLRKVAQMPGVYLHEGVLEKLLARIDFEQNIVNFFLEIADKIKSGLGNYSIGFHIMLLEAIARQQN